MATKQVPLVQTLDYAANQTRTLALEKVGLITHLDLRLLLDYTVTTGDPGYNQDFIPKLIKGLAIRDGQGHTWFAVGDGRQLYWLDYMLYQGMIKMDAMSTATGANKIAEAVFPLHFGTNPLNPFDPVSGIPAVELGQLALEITWRDAENLVTTPANFALNSLSVTVTPATILAGAQYNSIRPNLLLPNFRWENVYIAAAQGEIGLRRELPSGSILRQTALLSLDSDDTRQDWVAGDRDVTEVGYVKALENVIPFREKWQTLRARNQARYGLPVMTDWEGVSLINWGLIAGDVALDLRGRLPGLDLIGFTTEHTTGSIYILHIAYSA